MIKRYPLYLVFVDKYHCNYAVIRRKFNANYLDSYPLNFNKVFRYEENIIFCITYFYVSWR